MAKKVVNTYQVSFVKSLDISKDFKKKGAVHNRIEKKILLNLPVKKLLENERLLQEKSLQHNLNVEAVIYDLEEKLEQFKFLNLQIPFEILLYKTGVLEINPKLPTTTSLLKYLIKFDFGANNPGYISNWKKFVFKKKKLKEHYEVRVGSDDFLRFSYDNLITLVKLKICFNPRTHQNNFIQIWNTVIGSLKSTKTSFKVR